jgi:ketosteroid isomerase-like protein
MKQVSSLILMMILSLAVGCQSNGSSSADNGNRASAASNGGDVKREIAGLLKQHCDGLLKKDYATLDRLWADDLTFVNARGELLTKAQRLDNLRTGSTKFDSIDITEEAIRPYGDTAVSTGIATIKGQYSGQEGSGPYRVTIVWDKSHGAWKMVALQMTRIEK